MLKLAIVRHTGSVFSDLVGFSVMDFGGGYITDCPKCNAPVYLRDRIEGSGEVESYQCPRCRHFFMMSVSRNVDVERMDKVVKVYVDVPTDAYATFLTEIKKSVSVFSEQSIAELKSQFPKGERVSLGDMDKGRALDLSESLKPYKVFWKE